MVSKISKVKDNIFVPRTVTIRKDQDDWCDKNWVKLSKFLQDKLDEVIYGGIKK